jgi:inosose dehydratase
MSDKISRRQFVAGLGALAALSATSADALGQKAQEQLYPPADLSYFKKPITPGPAQINLGYAAITWGGNDVQAIKEIAEVGFRGIQLRSNLMQEYGDKPKALRDLLAEHKLTFTAFSSGGVRIAPGTEAEEIARHTRHAAFVRDAGGLYLQVTDSARPKDRRPAPEEFRALGRVLTEIGKRATDLGVPVGYHNHMHSLGESPAEVDRIMEASDAHFVKLLLDVAHYHQGGGGSAKAIRRYRDRLLFLHIKDVESVTPAANETNARNYRFVELGRGRVDLPAIFAALREINFRGWAVVELDSVPDKTRTPKESALISKKYLEEKLGMKI